MTLLFSFHLLDVHKGLQGLVFTDRQPWRPADISAQPASVDIIILVGTQEPEDRNDPGAVLRGPALPLHFVVK